MEPYQENAAINTLSNAEDVSIFDELKPLPVYYSEKAIRVFSVLLGVLFGSVMMAMNLNKTDGKKGISLVLVFGVLFSVAEIWGLNMIPKGTTGLTFGINFIGAAVLQQYFWTKFIGKDVAYNKRSVVVPSIVGIALTALFIAAVVYAPH